MSIAPNRFKFVNKIYNEMTNKANTDGRENKKKYFLQLVENEELFEDEKKYCIDEFIYNFEINNVLHKLGEPRECGRCKETRYSDKFCEYCISLYLQSLFNNWTS